MTAVLVGLASAVAFGASDFAAGVLSRRMDFALVGMVSQACATVGAWLLLPAFGGNGPTTAALSWGAASGVGGGLGTLALYRGLGRGQMSIVTPLSAVGGAALPAVAGLAFGEHLSLVTVLGIVLALPALWLVARPASTTSSTPAGVGEGLLAGVGFALLFIGLARAGGSSGLWPVAAGQCASLLVLTAFALTRRPSAAPRGVIGAALGVGILSVTATVLYFLAARVGQLTVVAVLSSLYPAITVLLAACLLRERASCLQRCGLIVAAAAVTLITVS